MGQSLTGEEDSVNDKAAAEVGTWAPRAPMSLVVDDQDGSLGQTVSRLLGRMRHSAFQGRKLGEAFEVWQRMIDGDGLICLGLAGSLASAGLAPLIAWLIERGYVDVIASTSANVTEDLLEPRGARFFQVEPEHVDDEELWRRGFYRFYDHVVGSGDYDAMEDFTCDFFEDLAARWPGPTLPGVRFMHEFGRWLDGQGLGGTIAATCFRHRVPLFVPAAAAGPSPHLAAIQITTDNAVFGGLGGASVASECISWGKEAVDGLNVMLFAD